MLSKRRATPEKLEKRARKAAVSQVRQKYAGNKGGDYANLSPAEKISIDKRISTKKPLIDKLAKKLLPTVRRKEKERMQSRSQKNEGTAMDRVKDAIEREKESDKIKHDRMKDRARTQDTDTINRGVSEEAEYEGRKVKLNDPFRLPSGSKKKFGVYVKNKKGNVIKVTFGDPNMEIKRDSPERRKSFRARHQCDTENDKTTARYWSCKMWEKGKKVSDLD